MNTSAIILSVVSTLLLLGVAIWFFNRKNTPKVSKTEDVKSVTDRPKENEIDDPLN